MCPCTACAWPRVCGPACHARGSTTHLVARAPARRNRRGGPPHRRARGVASGVLVGRVCVCGPQPCGCQPHTTRGHNEAGRMLARPAASDVKIFYLKFSQWPTGRLCPGSISSELPSTYQTLLYPRKLLYILFPLCVNDKSKSKCL